MKKSLWFACALSMLLWTDAYAQRGARGARGGAAPARVVSPEVTPERMVTFRLRAPEAKSVKVVVSEIFRQVPNYKPEWATGRFRDDAVPMTKGADGVWSITVGPITPDKYDYAFDVDGVHTLDPGNLDLKPGNDAWENWLTVRGTEPLYSDQKAVPHGTVTRVVYESKALGKNRAFNVYSPPGYEKSTEKYPVLYLLHGGGNHYQTWVTADANFIFDNLLAEGKIKPMVVVMPYGHVAPGSNPAPAGTPAGQFGADFMTEIMPIAEAKFRIQADPAHRAIAGLSMGAGQTLAIGFSNLDKFSHICLMSGGGLDSDGSLPDVIPAADKVNGALKLFWIGRGEGENAEGARRLSAKLKETGIKHDLHISPYGHSWITWRRDLNFEFAPKLFKN